jgi:hypothetical protein
MGVMADYNSYVDRLNAFANLFGLCRRITKEAAQANPHVRTQFR